MKVSHVIYKVENLQAGYSYFESKGFKIEYGSKKNPHNALIYFSEGPYIEVLESAPLPLYAKLFLKLIGKHKVVDRLNSWKNKKEGFVGLCLENYEINFEKEKRILEKYNQRYFVTKSKRLDSVNRLLKWKLLFPDALSLPFLMTYFNIDPKPKRYVHPNGTKGIKRISFGTEADLIPLMNELCDDDTLDLFVGNGVVKVEYGK